MLSHNGSVPIILNPMELSVQIGGCYDGVGAGCTAGLPSSNPIRLATGYFITHGGGFGAGATHAGRPAWDPSTVFFQMVGLADPGGGPYYRLSGNGTMSIAGTGFETRSTWTSAAPSNHFYTIMAGNYSVFESVLNALLFADFHGNREPERTADQRRKGGVPDDGRRRRK
jgi:hypothetical protein